MEIEFLQAGTTKAQPAAAIAFLSFEGGLLPAEAADTNPQLSDTIQNALKFQRFKGAEEETIVISSPSPPARVILVGAGEKLEIGSLALEQAAARAYLAVATSGPELLEIRFPVSSPYEAAHIALGALLAAYRFDKYRTMESADRTPSISRVSIIATDPAAAQTAFDTIKPLADSIYFVRDQVSEPANVLYPAEFARRIKALEVPGLEIDVLGVNALTDLGMNALLCVGQGSSLESRLVVMQWQGDKADKDPVALVGKGVCFDSGGLSIKSCKAMEGMKVDMAGAAAVAGAIHALARQKVKVNAVGVLALVENMPDGTAQRPGDIVVSMSGKTIEVVDTDAEGRLILADALWYCRDRFKPAAIVDVATLTGATVALGQEYAALFSNSDAVAKVLLAAARETGEQIWQLPLARRLSKKLESSVADMKNYDGPEGGAIAAALFLEQFIGDTPWAHLDIADVAWTKTSSCPTSPAGATGFGVRVLSQFAIEYHGQ